MCGRVVQKPPMSEIQVWFGTVNPLPNAAPTYNGAPTDTLPLVRLDRDGRRSLDLCRWGLIPYWAKDKSIGPRCINAMADTDGLPLALAGLWEGWKDRATGEMVQTFTIVTTVPNELCGAIHDRMPVILPRRTGRGGR